MKIVNKQATRERRRVRVRAKISGTAKRPRLNVYRSLRSMSVQLIDDEVGKTLFSVNSKNDAKDTKEAGERSVKVAIAYVLGKKIGDMAVEKGIKKIVFDRAGYKYHGRVKAVAEGARDAGLEF